ncbi:DUF6470 family protein [Tenuibacillus multivorans]|uniref:YviE n=1 Tax=Tenuibacillus multivorans TaxID=237069 RepID=A0A1H0G803_9BACI|nr:DUF6470 family protein [Tenuibacillus multivorans]GEL78709.1 hypothetical protein TMU01_29440 [Tenuibacillus multivorans]SDO02954.1 hypothetical protein SAMN05216498_0490 [Tenuibacillus multivorans]
MQFPQIRMQSQMALIGINTTQGQQTIEQPKAQLSIQQPKADVQIDRRPPKLDIDQSQAWSDMGLYGPIEAAERNAQEGKQAWLQSLAKESQEGDQLMKIENGGNAIASIGKNNAYEPMKEFNVGWIPSHFAVKTSYEPGEINIRVQRNEPIINAQTQSPIINYQRGDIEIYLRQQNELQIDVEI